MVRAIPSARKGLSKGLSARLGGRLGGGIGAKAPLGDARLKIIQSNRSNMLDARDKLASMAKNTDARAKLEKIRNLKEGKLEVKKIGSGQITLTKKTDGKILLSTAKKQIKPVKKAEKVEVKSVGQFTKVVTSNGQVSLSSKPRLPEGMRSKSEGRVVGAGGARSVVKGPPPPSGARSTKQQQGPLRTKLLDRRRMLSDEERLDEELMNCDVDPMELKRIQSFRSSKPSEKPQVPRYRDDFMGRRDRSRSPLYRSRSPVYRQMSPMRSRSPVRGGYGGGGAGVGGGGDRGRREWRSPPPARRPQPRPGFDYDDPRVAEEREEELMSRRMNASRNNYAAEERITMGGRIELGSSMVSPLQGSKIVITNLQTTVTQEDIVELFSDVGALKRAKLVAPGHAEVTFVNHSHAERAVDVYHNRQLDGKPMKCQLVGLHSVPASGGSSLRLPLLNSSKTKGPAPDVESIHRALFKKNSSAKRPTFTITMPKKGKDEPDW